MGAGVGEGRPVRVEVEDAELDAGVEDGVGDDMTADDSSGLTR